MAELTKIIIQICVVYKIIILVVIWIIKNTEIGG